MATNTMHDKFLMDVAVYYANSDIDMSNMVMLFPNKRSAIFMRRYLKHAFVKKNRSAFMPTMMTASAFLASFTTLREVDNAELMFILYQTYRDICLKKNATVMEFDRFIYWGDMILNDFDEIDNQLVDAKMLYTNLFRYKEIKGNYLTEGQIEVAKFLFGDNFQADNEHLWEHIAANDSKKAEKDLQEKFVQIWEILGDLYVEFNAVLTKKGLAYNGLVNRHGAEKICVLSEKEISYSRVAAIGFDSVSTSLCRIFKHLQEKKMIDFFWDTLDCLPDQCKRLAKSRATRLVDMYAKTFKQPEDFDEKLAEAERYEGAEGRRNIGKTEVSIISVPSSYAQTKIAGNIIKKWGTTNNDTQTGVKSGKLIEDKKPDSTAVVMPDASLLLPLVTAIPEANQEINVTMSVSYKYTPFSSLIKNIVSMIIRDRKVGGGHAFYYEDVLNIVSHQSLQAIAPEMCKAVTEEIRQNRLFNISADRLRELCSDSHMEFLFAPVKNANDVKEIGGYFKQLIEGLRSKIEEVSDPNTKTKSYEMAILEHYQDKIDHIVSLAQQYHLKMEDKTFIILIERMMSIEKINLSGLPIRGLQIMGLLETRAIDFDNLIVMSVNERVFPRRNYMRTFIPLNIRRVFQMNTPEDMESKYAYHFFHMINRARRVVLMYDSRGGDNAGECSRYISQIKYTYPSERLRFITPELRNSTEQVPLLSIDKKRADVTNLLNEYRSDKGGGRALSVSALKKYRQCHLRFFVEQVLKVQENDTPQGFIEASTLGTVVHNVLEKLYKPKTPGRALTKSDFDMMLNPKQVDIKTLVLSELNATQYRGRYTDCLNDMPAEAKLMANELSDLVRKVLTYDGLNSPVTVSGVEQNEEKPWRVNPDLEVNFKMFIDRVDKLPNNALKFIDYKTGGDKPTYKNVASLFSPKYDDSNDGVFQLFAYAVIYSAITGFQGDIKPELYCLCNVETPDAQSFAVKDDTRKTIINSYKDVLPEFENMLRYMVSEIFDDNIFFNAGEDPNNCRYCPIIEICNREVPPKVHK